MAVQGGERRAGAARSIGGAALALLPLIGVGADGIPRTVLPTVVIAPEWDAVDAQRTPKTVDTLPGSALDAAGLHDTIALQYGSPGFIFKTNAVLGQPYLRGVGSDIISAGVESSIATFVDGVYMPRAYDTIVDFFDVERVEVLKGPQGVHMGRNAVGGAVSIHTRDPVPYREGYVDVLGGTYAQRRVRAAVNVPLAGPVLALRIAGAAARRDGYVDNINLGTDVDDEDYRAVRAKLRYAPGERFELLFGAERFSENSSRALGSQPDPDVGVSGGIRPAAPCPTIRAGSPRTFRRTSMWSPRATACARNGACGGGTAFDFGLAADGSRAGARSRRHRRRLCRQLSRRALGNLQPGDPRCFRGRPLDGGRLLPRRTGVPVARHAAADDADAERARRRRRYRCPRRLRSVPAGAGRALEPAQRSALQPRRSQAGSGAHRHLAGRGNGDAPAGPAPLGRLDAGTRARVRARSAPVLVRQRVARLQGRRLQYFHDPGSLRSGVPVGL